MSDGMRSLAELLPDGRLQVLEGQTHLVKAKALAPAVKPFLGVG